MVDIRFKSNIAIVFDGFKYGGLKAQIQYR